MASGAEAVAARWLSTGKADLDSGITSQLDKLKAALEKESDVVVLFGAEITGAAVRDLVSFGARLPGRTRYMALGDFVNSRGAADMGLLPDRLPGYASVADPAARALFSKLWGAEIPATPGLDARAMLAAAAAGRLKALYVVGANPFRTFQAAPSGRPAGLDLLVVHELFLTETAQCADIVLPAACVYEKEGTVTNTAGEVQRVRRSMDPQGPRSDFDLLRILMHQLASLGLGSAPRARTADAVFEEMRQSVPGYDLPLANLLTGGAEIAAASFAASDPSYDADGLVFSSRDNLFSSGTLGRYCSKLNSCNEAKEVPWSSSPSTQSWWYR
jgi:NADH-quinone oxidoreductase subunit G